MLILLSQNEQGISALDLQKHIFPSGSSSMKSTFPWMQRHYVNYYKGEPLYETNRRETALTHPRSDMKNQEYSIKHQGSTGSDSKGSRVRIRLQWASTLRSSS